MRSHLEQRARGALARPGALPGLFAVRPHVALRRLPGRETFAWPAASPEFIVKRSCGRPARDRWYDLRRGLAWCSAGRREFENLEALSAAGFRVPRPLGWAEEGGGRSLVVMEYVQHSETLSQRLERDPQGGVRLFARPLAELVAALHRCGWYHRDLYLEHVVLEPQGGLCLLDLGRARRERAPRRRWFVKDLAALAHSVPAVVPTHSRLRLLASYLEASDARSRGALRRWASHVEAHRARMASHRPRHVHQPGPDEEAVRKPVG